MVPSFTSMMFPSPNPSMMRSNRSSFWMHRMMILSNSCCSTDTILPLVRCFRSSMANPVGWGGFSGPLDERNTALPVRITSSLLPSPVFRRMTTTSLSG